jgi:uncharacterized protein
VSGPDDSRSGVDAALAEPVLVPVGELAPELLRAVIEAFVLREGTDYGAREYTLDEKVAHVESQLRRGEAAIVYDPNTETVDIRRSGA